MHFLKPPLKLQQCISQVIRFHPPDVHHVMVASRHPADPVNSMLVCAFFHVCFLFHVLHAVEEEICICYHARDHRQ